MARRIGFWLGLGVMAAAIALPPPGGLSEGGWLVAGLLFWMAAWWMTEAMPLTATALLPFVVLPFAEVGTASEVASDYYSPILFLILGGAFIALAIERTGLHRRLALAILDRVGAESDAPGFRMRLLLAFMTAAAIISCVISNTSTTLIMMPMALAVVAGGEGRALAGAGGSARASAGSAPAIEGPPESMGLAGALPMGLAFAASIGGLGTLIGSPTNAIAVALLRDLIGFEVSFALWSAFGLPLVILGIPLAAFIIGRLQRVNLHPFDALAARAAIAPEGAMTVPERRLLPVIAIAFASWTALPWLTPLLPPDSLTDGTVAIIAGLTLFVLPDGTGRPMLLWREADRAPWGVIMMFGGGLALAGAMGRSGLATWLGEALLPLSAWPLILVTLAVVALVIAITEFASNVAAASGIMPVIASLAVAMNADPVLIAIPAAFAASWGFMLPSGTGPNAIAWATGRIRLANMVRAGLALDLAGIFLITGIVWAVAALL